jgi:hypothetical protein
MAIVHTIMGECFLFLGIRSDEQGSSVDMYDYLRIRCLKNRLISQAIVRCRQIRFMKSVRRLMSDKPENWDFVR